MEVVTLITGIIETIQSMCQESMIPGNRNEIGTDSSEHWVK